MSYFYNFNHLILVNFVNKYKKMLIIAYTQLFLFTNIVRNNRSQ